LPKPKANNMKNIQQAFSTNSLIHGLFMTVSGAVVAGAYSVIQSGAVPSGAQFKTIALAGVGAGLAYLMKNCFAGSSQPAADSTSQPTKP
jgi:hypothetical protein